MTEPAFQVHFWGVRGSIPVSGPEYVRYGGNTACIEIRCSRRRILLDGGSGLRACGKALAREGVDEIDLFLTHSHYDHVVGLPFFHPLYDPKVKLILWSGHLHGRMTTHEMVREFMRPPWFPVEAECCTANVHCRDFTPGDVLTPRDGIVLRTCRLNHPGGCVGYRVEANGRSMALISDTEHIAGELDAEILALIQGADLVVYDSTYLESELARYRGFGHSTWEQGVKLCKAASVKRLALFHHDPTRTDAQMDAIEHDAQNRFPGAFAARDGMTIDL